MPRFYFDHHENGVVVQDDEGLEFASRNEARTEAMKALPAVAKDGIVHDGDRQAYTVVVRDNSGVPIYSATLTFAGLWLSAN